MFNIALELKALKLYGMASAYADLTAQSTASVSASEWLIQHLLEAEATDRIMRSIRYQLTVAKFPIHRILADFDFSQSKAR